MIANEEEGCFSYDNRLPTNRFKFDSRSMYYSCKIIPYFFVKVWQMHYISLFSNRVSSPIVRIIAFQAIDSGLTLGKCINFVK